MQVTINIDENMFAEVIEKELKALSSDQLQNIIISAIQKYFEENGDNLIRDLLIHKDYYNTVPTGFMREIVKNADYSKLNDFVSKSIDYLSNNHESILRTVILEAITNGLTNTYSYKMALEDKIRNVMYEMRNNGAM